MKIYLHYLFRLKELELISMHRLCLLIVLPFLLTSFSGFCQVVLSLDHKVKAGMPASTLSGDSWLMQLNYSVSSITGFANGVKITVVLPDYVNDANGVIGTTHAPVSNFVFDNTPGAKRLTINFIDPVPSGSNGVLEYRLSTRNGFTPDETTIEACATMTDGSAATSGIECDEMPIVAHNRFCGYKQIKSGGAIGHPLTYRIFLARDPAFSPSTVSGTLNASNITISDYYPAGATLVSANVVNSDGVVIPTTITTGPNSVTTTIPDYIISTSNGIPRSYFEVTVLYSAPTFNTTNPVTNRASITYTPLGESPVTIDETSGANGGFCTNDLLETYTLQDAVTSATLVKNTPADSVVTGTEFNYSINFTNTGTTPLENVVIIENVPDELTFVSSRIDAFHTHVDSLHYQTDIDTTWRYWLPGSGPISVVLGGGKITKIKLTLVSPYGAGETFVGTNILTFRANSNVTSPTAVENCLSWSTSTSSIVTNDVCNDNVTITPVVETGRILYEASMSPSCVSNSIGQVITMTGKLTSLIGYDSTENPVLGFFIPDAFEFVSGSETFNAGTSGITGTPTLSISSSYVVISGISYSLYKWTFPTETIVPPSSQISINFGVELTNRVVADVNYPAFFFADGSNVTIRDRYFGTVTVIDSNDWDADGDATEEIKLNATDNSCHIRVGASAEMESVKWVKGSLDTDFSRYPATGSTVPGGNADYKLIVKNTGNIPMKDIKIIDILPFVGDRGVIDPQTRLTEWRPNLAAPISAPAGIDVSYSTEPNPCRDELRQPGDPSPFPTGCIIAGWSTTPPADITRVQSVKIDFGSTVLAVGDSLIFSWPMRAPVTAPTSGEIAWNSFGFVATRTDNNQPLIAAEPIKVGIEVITGLPAHYGDRVWYDDNRNGLQDEGEAGVNGVTVHLYAPVVAGIQNPGVDSLVNFTITGNNGLYKFSNLTPGEYYAVFFLPSGFSISPDNVGSNDAIDSDGVTGTVDGQTVTIVPITTLDKEEEDYTWDQGIYCLLTPAVTPVQIVAANGSATLTASGGTSYLWTGPNGFTASTASITINPVSPADTGMYVVTIMDGECRASLSTEIQIESYPVIELPQITSQTICAGESTTLTGTCVSPATIVWYSDSGLTAELSSTTVNPPITTTYYAVCKDADCVSTASSQAIVRVTEVPTISIAGPAVCAPDGLTYSATVTATTGAVITSSVGTVSGNTVSGIPSGTTATITATVGTCSDSVTITENCTAEIFDLALRKVLPNGAKSPAVAPGSTVTFKIEVWNQGNVDAQNVVLTDYIPNGLTLVADGNWTARPGVATLTNPIAALAAGDSTSVNISFTVNSGFSGSIRNFAEISDADNTAGLKDIDSTPDSNPGNDGTPKDDEIAEDRKNNPTQDEDDHDFEEITVSPTPVFDLALRKTMASGSKTIYKVGDEVTFTITVFNQGTVAATSVDLVDYIPVGLTLQDTNWTLNGDKARWNGAISNLAPGAQQTVQITFVINLIATGVIVNTAEINRATNPENLEDKDSTQDDIKDNDNPVKNDEINENGEDGGDQDDHDIEPISICPDAKCLNVKTTRKK